jgi:hypothetical protein
MRSESTTLHRGRFQKVTGVIENSLYSQDSGEKSSGKSRNVTETQEVAI